MKCNMFSAALAFAVLGLLVLQMAPGRAQTTVIPHESGSKGSAVVIERDGQPPAVLDENKDIKGMVATPSVTETTGSAVRDAQGNLVAKPKKDCIKESWTGGRRDEKCN